MTYEGAPFCIPVTQVYGSWTSFFEISDKLRLGIDRERKIGLYTDLFYCVVQNEENKPGYNDVLAFFSS